MQIEREMGMLIVLEGIDGAGKTTQAHLLAGALQAKGFEVVTTKEPTNGPHGTRLRKSAVSGRLEPEEELALFILDRQDHVSQLIAPSLQRGAAVIVDRYYLSTAAYQGARGLDAESILTQNEAFAPIPDAAILLVVDVNTGRRRIQDRGDGEGNLFERKAELERVSQVFSELDRDYIVRIDGSAQIGAVHATILNYVEAIVSRLGPKLRHQT